MDATWYISRNSSTEKYCGAGAEYTRFGKGKTPDRCHSTIAASISGVHIRSGLSGVEALSSGTETSL